MKVIIITEGSKIIGLGHITRCISIYQAFNSFNVPVLLIVNGDETVQEMVKDINNSKVFNWMEESNKLFKLIEREDVVIVDSYKADVDFYQKIAQMTKIAVYVDDNNRINYPKGVTVNGSINAEKIDYSFSEETNYLLGTQFIPLRQEFWKVPEKKIKSKVENVMVTFGGDDLRNLTPKILELLNDNYPSLNKKIIIGSGFRYIHDIENLKDERTELIYYPDANGMLNTMLESDIAISAGGQTLYELARVGLPTIAISVADNQTHNVTNWEEVGFVEFAGHWEDKDLFNNILSKFNMLSDEIIRLKKSNVGKTLVDGKGALRVAKYSLNKYYVNKLKLRPATCNDIYDVFELSNEEEVRMNSFNTSKIGFEEHKKWFKNKIEDQNCVFLLIEIANEFAGQVRFDLEDDFATVSISIKKEFRQFGLGKDFLIKSLDHLKLNFPQIRVVKAYIKEENQKSLKLFESLGFKYKESVLIKNQKAFEYIYKISG